MKFFKNESDFPSRGDFLVSAGTGLFHDFQMSIVIKLLAVHKMQLTDEDVKTVLRRYHSHVSHWNVPLEAIMAELERFAHVVGRKPYDITTWFNQISYPGMFNVYCGNLCCKTPDGCTDCARCALGKLEDIEI